MDGKKLDELTARLFERPWETLVRTYAEEYGITMEQAGGLALFMGWEAALQATWLPHQRKRFERFLWN